MLSSKDKAKTFSLHQSISSILETCVSLLHLPAFGDESHLKAFGNLEKKECVRKNGGATTAPLQELNLLMQKGRLSKAEVDWLQKSLKRIEASQCCRLAVTCIKKSWRNHRLTPSKDSPRKLSICQAMSTLNEPGSKAVPGEQQAPPELAVNQNQSIENT